MPGFREEGRAEMGVNLLIGIGKERRPDQWVLLSHLFTTRQ
jgi:hypothetical protein